jgi:hypothetical protein
LRFFAFLCVTGFSFFVVSRSVYMSVEPGRYRHYKGNYYEVIGTARHSETDELLVVYRPLYGERGLWVRPQAMFEETVTAYGRTVPRFARCEDE